MDRLRRNITKRRRAVVALGLVAVLSALSVWTEDPRGASSDPASWRTSRQLEASAEDATAHPNMDPSLLTKVLQFLARSPGDDGWSTGGASILPHDERHLICGRATGLHKQPQHSRRQLNEEYTSCPAVAQQWKIAVPGYPKNKCWGRTGNALVSLVNALQYTKDKGMLLGLMRGSCLMDELQSMFMIRGSAEEWEARIEEALCVRVIRSKEDLKAYVVHAPQNKAIFHYRGWASQDERVSRMLHVYRTLFQNYNDGSGVDWDGNPTRDMCSGIQSLFPGDLAGAAAYSVIHLRHLENDGRYLLAGQSERTGCDPVTALDMPPGYVKSILGPLGMLHNPIVLMTDGQNYRSIRRLLSDPEIGPNLRFVPEEARWIGGDFTLGVMADAFIGNPASTASGFVARARVALGMGENYIFMRHDKERGWERSCGDDCLFAPLNRTGTGLEDWTLEKDVFR